MYVEVTEFQCYRKLWRNTYRNAILLPRSHCIYNFFYPSFTWMIFRLSIESQSSICDTQQWQPIAVDRSLFLTIKLLLQGAYKRPGLSCMSSSRLHPLKHWLPVTSVGFKLEATRFSSWNLYLRP